MGNPIANSLSEMVEVIQAYQDNRPVEFRLISQPDHPFVEMYGEEPFFNFDKYYYREKKVPRDFYLYPHNGDWRVYRHPGALEGEPGLIHVREVLENE